MSGAVRDELSAGTARRISYAEQRKRPVEGPKGCSVSDAVRNELFEQKETDISMAEFRIKIAGRVAGVTSRFESTRDYCGRYLTEEAAAFEIAVSPEDVVREQALADLEAEEEGLKRRRFSEPFLERAVIQRKLSERLLTFDTLLFHGSSVAVDGEGFLFTAACGTGKSTHTRLYREVFGERAVMVNDDKPFLRLADGGVILCGSPWSGKHGLDTNVEVPLKGICILERGGENTIRPITPEEAAPMLLHQSGAPLEEELLPHFHELVKRLGESVPLWKMQCTKDREAARLSYEAMSGKEIKTQGV